MPQVPQLDDGPYPRGVQLWSSQAKERQRSGGFRRADMYVCGITPYDATHMGHAATYVAFDLLNRVWRDAGYPVRYVQNVTDIDDPLLIRATERGEKWDEIARRETQLFREDMTALRVIPPDHYIGAVESIPLVVSSINKLMANDHGYLVDTDIYFDISSDPDFGTRSSLSIEEQLKIFTERGGDPERPGKRSPLDCLLWRSQREGEPYWESEIGPGRPGWHIECSAIALHYLGETIDVQGGGSDLLFPHHDMGAAEAYALTGKPYSLNYVHAGMIQLDGEKMSKSRGNLIFLSQLRASGVDPMAIRLALLSDHYRTDRDWSIDQLDRANDRLSRWRTALSRRVAGDPKATIIKIRESLSQDLDAPTAIAAIDDWVQEQDGCGLVGAAQELSRVIDALLGVEI